MRRIKKWYWSPGVGFGWIALMCIVWLAQRGDMRLVRVLWVVGAVAIAGRAAAYWLQDQREDREEPSAPTRQITMKKLQTRRAAVERAIRAGGVEGGLTVAELEAERVELDRQIGDLEGG